jgi:cytochrome c biogenesis protein CcdA/thiol-disulfide isomerase/thioredoxin
MLVLIGIAFAAGVITAISPCVFPVLPIIFAGSASGGRRRPYAIIGGLVTTFVISLLLVTWLLRQLHLPQDILRDVAIGLLFLVAATLIVPQFGELIERPLYRLTRRPAGDLGGGFLLGASLGLVFVPCGGPVLAYITTQTASLDLGWKRVVLAVSYALGAAVPMLALALGGRRAAGAIRPLGTRRARMGLGALMAIAALLITFNVDRTLQTKVNDYTSFLQKHVEQTCAAQKRLVGRCEHSSTTLADLGPAPEIKGISQWINSDPLTLRQLRGKVVLVDFWTYSCINCLRTLPHVKAWYSTYRDRGFVVLGIHTPEFAFEHVPGNVEGAVKRLGIQYPVALDNDYATWNAFKNQYWPAKYLIDRRGHIRFQHFGEGDYDTTEARIRTLLGESAGSLPVANELPDPTPHTVLTPETYLGYKRLQRFSQSTITPDQFAQYSFPKQALQESELSYSGTWKVTREEIVAGLGARLRLSFIARQVHLVLGGHGEVNVLFDGVQQRTVRVNGSRLYTLLRMHSLTTGLLELQFSPGVRGYAFTFG